MSGEASSLDASRGRWRKAGGLMVLFLFFGAAFAAGARQQGAAQSPIEARIAVAEAAIFSAPVCDREGVGALGLVEPAGRAYRIGAPGEGVVARVAVAPGDRVKAGAVLFAMDDRAAQAALRLAARSLELAQARAGALRADFRRKVQAVRAAEAALQAAEAAEADANDLAEIAERLGDGAVLSARERTHRRLAAAKARASAVEAAAWRSEAAAERDALDPDGPGAKVVVAAAEIAEARARLEAARVEADRLIVRAPVAGLVLDVSARPGARLERGAAAPVLLAADGPAQLRVEIDALDLGRFDAQAAATARRRGAADVDSMPLRFLRREPMVSAKSQFADALSEPIDRRVATAVYALPKTAVETGVVSVGELLEVSIAANCGSSLRDAVAFDASR